MQSTKLVDTFQKARKAKALAVIEGVQALKHAARFGALFEHIVTADSKVLKTLLEELAPDVRKDILKQITEATEETFAKLSPNPHRTKVVAIAKRTTYKINDLGSEKPIVFLEDPKDLENIGAVIRVSAAADAGGVCISSLIDVWHPAVIRGAAGLQFALPVLNIAIEDLIKTGRPLISLDPTGNKPKLSTLPKNAILIFGTERHGISGELLKRSDHIIRLPMRKGVSSLNLATSVAATLYSI